MALCVAAVVGLGIFSGVFTAIRLFGSPPSLFEPEDPTVTVRRASPDNAFYLLSDAAREILEVKGTYPDIDLDRILFWDTRLHFLALTRHASHKLPQEIYDPRRTRYKPFPLGAGTFGIAVDARTRWMNDPNVSAFAAAVGPVLDTMRQALRKPYYLLPTTDDPGGFANVDSYYYGVRALSQALELKARMCQLKGMHQSGLALGVETVNLGVTYASDGPLRRRDDGCGIQTKGCYLINESLEDCDDLKTLKGTLAELKAIDQKDAPWDYTVEFEFRNAERLSFAMPRVILPAPGELPERSEVERRLNVLSRLRIRLMDSALQRPIRRYICDYLKIYPSGCEGPYWLTGKGLPELPPKDRSWNEIASEYIDGLEQSRFRQALCVTFRRATLANVALRIWYLQNGSYPDTLEALVPELLAEIPLDDVNMKPLEYRFQGANRSYVLRSITGEYHTPGKCGSLQVLAWDFERVIDQVEASRRRLIE